MKGLLTALMILGSAFQIQDVAAENNSAVLSLNDTVDSADLGHALSEGDMGRETGRQGIRIDEMNNVLNTTESTASVGSNVLTSMATGLNNVSDNAFGTTSGIATIIQNSGNQNVIQNSFILNLSIK